MPLLEASQIADKVRNLMIRKGIKRSLHARVLADITGKSVSQSYKKFNGRADLTLAEIRQVEMHFGEPILDTTDEVEFTEPGETLHGNLTEIEGYFVVAGKKFPCQIGIGPQRSNSTKGQFYCAFVRAGEWYVSESAECPPGAVLYTVKHVHLTPNPLKKEVFSIAILDDEKLSADNMQAYFVAKGHQAVAFYDKESFLRALSTNHFDGFIVDWLLEAGTSETAIARIRKLYGDRAPIFVITGGLRSGDAALADARALIPNYKVNGCHTKPISMKAVSDMMLEALA